MTTTMHTDVPVSLHSPVLSTTLYSEQIKLERESIQSGRIKYRELVRDAVDRKRGTQLVPAEALMRHWFEPFTAAIGDEVEECRAQIPAVGRTVYGPVLLELQPERLAAATMTTALDLLLRSPDGVKAFRLCHQIGRSIIAEINHDQLARSDAESLRQLERRFKRVYPGRLNWWARKRLTNPLDERRAMAQTGSVLLGLLLECAWASDYEEDEFRPAFVHETRRVRTGKLTKTVGVVRLSEEAAQIMDESHRAREVLRPVLLPMIVPPQPWGRVSEGGYVSIRLPFVVRPTRAQKAAYRDADLSRCERAVNAVQSSRMRINRRVFEVAQEVWDRGGRDLGVKLKGKGADRFGGRLGIPSPEPIPVPEKPDDFLENPESRAQWNKAASRVHARNIHLRGYRRLFLQKLRTAERFVESDAIYFPHQLDFRGRVYAMPQPFNYQSDDLCRGLLQFSDPIDPGAEGEEWLLIEAANCYGQDKMPFADRAEWARRMSREIEGCVRDPIGSLEFWGSADDPWQFLAACFALTDGDAARRLPVKMDGTCNGLQQYAALGRDRDEAALVNMLPADAPADIYSRISEIVTNRVEHDAAQGVEEAKASLPFMGRAIVKPNAMTDVYGVTLIGARRQVQDVLEGMFGVNRKESYRLSKYIVHHTMAAIRKASPNARRIMDWLGAVADEVSKRGHLVRWTSPMGFPVVQDGMDYRQMKKVRVKTVLQMFNIARSDDAPVRRTKQRDAFAPNFVHSVDACHLMMTAEQMGRESMAFIGVHDSFGTHAAHVGAMHGILREQFVALHRQPILEHLADDMRLLFGVEIDDAPVSGTLDIEDVLQAPYFFS